MGLWQIEGAFLAAGHDHLAEAQDRDQGYKELGRTARHGSGSLGRRVGLVPLLDPGQAWRLPKFVKEVVKAQEGMTPGHAWAGVAHDGLDPIALQGTVTVHLTVVAGRFFLAEGAGGQTPPGIVQQCRAVWAQGRLAAMVIAAVNGQHG